MSTDLKVDPVSTWVRLKNVWPVVFVTGVGVATYMSVTQSIQRLEETVNRDATQRIMERENIVQSVNEVRDELRKVFVDTVLARQAQAWIELARALNKDRYPNLVWPDLPR